MYKSVSISGSKYYNGLASLLWNIPIPTTLSIYNSLKYYSSFIEITL